MTANQGVSYPFDDPRSFNTAHPTHSFFPNLLKIFYQVTFSTASMRRMSSCETICSIRNVGASLYNYCASIWIISAYLHSFNPSHAQTQLFQLFLFLLRRYLMKLPCFISPNLLPFYLCRLSMPLFLRSGKRSAALRMSAPTLFFVACVFLCDFRKNCIFGQGKSPTGNA